MSTHSLSRSQTPVENTLSANPSWSGFNVSSLDSSSDEISRSIERVETCANQAKRSFSPTSNQSTISLDNEIHKAKDAFSRSQTGELPQKDESEPSDIPLPPRSSEDNESIYSISTEPLSGDQSQILNPLSGRYLPAERRPVSPSETECPCNCAIS